MEVKLKYCRKVIEVLECERELDAALAAAPPVTCESYLLLEDREGGVPMTTMQVRQLKCLVISHSYHLDVLIYSLV